MLETAKLYLLSSQTFVLKKRPGAKLKNRVSHLFIFGARDLANPYSLVFVVCLIEAEVKHRQEEKGEPSIARTYRRCLRLG